MHGRSLSKRQYINKTQIQAGPNKEMEHVLFGRIYNMYVYYTVHFIHVLTAGWRLRVPRGPPELVQHFRLQGSSHRRKSAACPKFDMVWQYRSPIPVGRRVEISSCRGRGVCGGQHPVILWVKVLLSPTLYTTCDYCTRSTLLTNIVCCWQTRFLKGFDSSTKIFLGDRPTFKTQFCSQPSFCVAR